MHKMAVRAYLSVVISPVYETLYPVSYRYRTRRRIRRCRAGGDDAAQVVKNSNGNKHISDCTREVNVVREVKNIHINLWAHQFIM